MLAEHPWRGYNIMRQHRSPGSNPPATLLKTIKTDFKHSQQTRASSGQSRRLPMKSHKEELWFNTKTRREYINITPEVQKVIDKSGIQEGLCLVNPMHITASVFVNDDEQGLIHDFDKLLETLAPHAPVEQYRHNDTGEDNADAHLKRQLMGRESLLAVTRGKLDLGPWEQIFYGEFDGRRKKRVLVKIIGE